MGKIEKTVEFDAAPEKVWAVVSDPSRFGEWLGMHKSWKGDVPAEFTKGAQATAVVSLLNMPNTITWTVAELEPNKFVKLTGTGMAGVKVSIGLGVEPKGSGSAMSISAEFEGQMLVGAIGAAVEKAGRTELDESTAKLQTLVS
ncbi:MAG: type II toxin-antitoxin system Rv0910 family toxin [Jatrophihabitans sp.]